MMDGFGHGWGMGWGWFVILAIIVLIVWLIVNALNKKNNRSTPADKSALDILKDRYARAEIDKQEFEEKKKELL